MRLLPLLLMTSCAHDPCVPKDKYDGLKTQYEFIYREYTEALIDNGQLRDVITKLTEPEDIE